MSSNLKKNLKDLEFISNIKCPKTKKVILKHYSNKPKFNSALKEIAMNIIKGNVELSNKQKSRLKKDKKSILGLCNNKVCKKSKKFVVQSGGWLWVLPVISTIIDLIK